MPKLYSLYEIAIGNMIIVSILPPEGIVRSDFRGGATSLSEISDSELDDVYDTCHEMIGY